MYECEVFRVNNIICEMELFHTMRNSFVGLSISAKKTIFWREPIVAFHKLLYVQLLLYLFFTISSITD